MGRAKVRGNGQGTVYKRGKTWTAEVNMFAGDYRRRVTKGGFETKREAVAYLGTLVHSLSAEPVRTVSFQSLWEKWTATQTFQQLGKGKKRDYARAYARCNIFYALSDVRKCSYDACQSIVQGLTHYQARDVKRVLNGMFELAQKMECLEKNVAPLIEIPAVPPAKNAFFTDAQVQAIRECPHASRDYALLMIETGMRPIEMRSLTVEEVDFDARLCMGGRKANTEMPIALSDEAMRILKRMCEQVGTGKVCRMGQAEFYQSFQEMLVQAGIQRADEHVYTPYACRHTYVTRLTRAGVPPAVIQKAARHTSYKTTQGYTHLDVQDVLSALRLVCNSVGNRS